MSLKIHPSAIVDKNAVLGTGVEIGAYSIIGPKVVIGDNCWIGNHANLTGNTTIGENSKIYHYASIGEAPQDKKYNGEDTRLVIGNNNTIREYCTLNTGTAQDRGVTTIGHNNWIMAYVHIAHDCIVGDNTIFANGVTLAGHVTVKNWAILGGLSPIHQYCIIGEHTMVGGQSSVAQDIPPYTLASGFHASPRGINVEGLKRRGFSIEQIDNIKQAYKILYRNGLSYNEAREIITEMADEHHELKPFVEFFKQSTRGIIR
jgi:UDP-N-acetylglucosamine acyltransferase